jgi:hypothetical protein
MYVRVVCNNSRWCLTKLAVAVNELNYSGYDPQWTCALTLVTAVTDGPIIIVDTRQRKIPTVII